MSISYIDSLLSHYFGADIHCRAVYSVILMMSLSHFAVVYALIDKSLLVFGINYRYF